MDIPVHIHAYIYNNMSHRTCVYRWYSTYIRTVHYTHCESDVLLITVGSLVTYTAYCTQFSVCVPHDSSCIKHSLPNMSTPSGSHAFFDDRTEKPNMERQATLAPVVAPPPIDDKTTQENPVVEPVV
jgi:hypothetical protein